MGVMLKFEKFQGFCCHAGQNSPFSLTLHVGPYHSAALHILYIHTADVHTIQKTCKYIVRNDVYLKVHLRSI